MPGVLGGASERTGISIVVMFPKKNESTKNIKNVIKRILAIHAFSASKLKKPI